MNMSMIDLQEQEQLDALKTWWKDNRKWMLTVLAIVAVAYAALTYWKSYQGKQAADASTLYAEVLKQVASNDNMRINDSVAVLVEKYSNTAYAPRAQLLAVQSNIQVKDMVRAKTQLEWVIAHAGERGLQDTARLKLSSILLDEKDYTAAMKLLDATHPDAFVGLFADLKGDVLAAQGKTDEARAAYKLAFEKMDSKSAYRNLIQLKLDGLGTGVEGGAK
jgi:predicted negative regulator of RcsB-dependent stress response